LQPIADAIELALRRWQRNTNIPAVFTDYREMIEKGDLHAIVVAA
jgi:predicted dehydrogenase